ncbi:MAG: branched-chain amino acid ABC transporter permease [Anaerosomatales bacterium]|nr:branched-chain amino acid ABC transporter permease [Anaerosomatales bacterium]MDT8434801.1 branched-chain amino acid ABC transporter permease [Anaerosomatales bacterium]
MANPFSRISNALGTLPRWVYVGLALAFAIVFPMLEYFGLMETLWLRLGTRTLVYVLLAVGLNLVLGETGLLHLGYVAFFAVGAYSTAILSSPRFDLQWNFWAILLVATGMAMLFGFVVGVPSLRLRGDYLAIVTLAFGEIMRMTLNNWETLTNGPGGIPGIYPPNIFGWVVDQPAEFYYLLLVFVVIIVALVSNLKNSRIGRAWNALREDEIAAHHSGVRPTQAKMLAVIMSSGIAGLAGAIFAYYQQFINPTYFLFMQSVIVVCMVVLGGMGSIPGAILGAVALDATPEIIRQTFTAWLPRAVGSDFLPGVQAALQTEFDRYRMLIFGLVIVLMVIFRPEGLLPNKLWRREVREEDPRELEHTRQHLFDFEEGKQDLEV